MNIGISLCFYHVTLRARQKASPGKCDKIRYSGGFASGLSNIQEILVLYSDRENDEAD